MMSANQQKKMPQYISDKLNCPYAYLYRLSGKNECIGSLEPAVGWLISQCRKNNTKNLVDFLRSLEGYDKLFLESDSKNDSVDKYPYLIKTRDNVWIKGISSNLTEELLELRNRRFPEIDECKDSSISKEKLSQEVHEEVRKVHSLSGQNKLVKSVATYIHGFFQKYKSAGDATSRELRDVICGFIGRRRFFGIMKEWDEKDFKEYSNKKKKVGKDYRLVKLDPELDDGRVYNPPLPDPLDPLRDPHTWNFNKEWVLALLAKNCPFYIISTVSEKNFFRTNSPVFSAFSREIALVAIFYNYSLEVEKKPPNTDWTRKLDDGYPVKVWQKETADSQTQLSTLQQASHTEAEVKNIYDEVRSGVQKQLGGQKTKSVKNNEEKKESKEEKKKQEEQKKDQTSPSSSGKSENLPPQSNSTAVSASSLNNNSSASFSAPTSDSVAITAMTSTCINNQRGGNGSSGSVKPNPSECGTQSASRVMSSNTPT